jgi:hypothetical protein
MSDRLLYSEHDYPVFQNRVYHTYEEARNCPVGSIRIVEDGETGLVHNADFTPDVMVYDEDYQNEQGNSPSFRAHLETVRGIVLDQLGNRELVEVGCGKAYFLEMLQQFGAEIHGFDPTYQGSNPAVQKHYFASGVGLSGRGIILRHVLEHVENPFSFLVKIAEANGGTGLIYIEVPCFEWICRARAWFDIFYEHVNYFRMSDFQRMFGSIAESGRLFGDQYLYVVADLSTLRRPRIDRSNRVDFPADFTREISDLGVSESDREQPTVVWGGASKGVVFSLLRERSGRPVDHVIDINAEKQGAYLPKTGVRVQSPDEVLVGLPQRAPIYVMNPNYLPEIRKMTGDRFTYLGVGRD